MSLGVDKFSLRKHENLVDGLVGLKSLCLTGSSGHFRYWHVMSQLLIREGRNSEQRSRFEYLNMKLNIEFYIKLQNCKL